MAGDLATLADVKSWVNSSGQTMASTDDPLLTRLIASASQAIKRELARDVFVRTYTAEPYNGNGRQRLTLRQAPIWSVSKVLIAGVSVPRSLDGIVSGYMWRSYGEIQLIGGYAFGNSSGSLQSVFVTYQAGYFETMPSTAIPTTPFQITASPIHGTFDSDLGVTNATTGVSLTKVAAGPVTGQYSVSTAGLYTFAAADVGTSVNVSCGILPGPLNQACLELVLLKYRERKRAGEKSSSLGGQHITFYTPKDIKDTVGMYLDPYRRMGWSI